MKTMVIGLGGNALLSPGKSQNVHSEYMNAAKAMHGIAGVIKTSGYNVVITHGNGPQVGDELVRNNHAKGVVPQLPLHILTAETEASIGSVLETVLRNELEQLHVAKDVAVILTHTIVERRDRAFARPTKPIGPIYSRAELEAELKLGKFDYVRNDSGYRKVVPSPNPVGIVEAKTIKSLISSTVVIAAGGGGIPVFADKDGYAGAKAVIDKDLATQVLANSVGADEMVILTDIDSVYRDFESRKNPIKRIKAEALKKQLKGFEEGTMRPKLEACIRFIENGGRVAYVGGLYRLKDVLEGRSGTAIVR
jgi:carbamate kinase